MSTDLKTVNSDWQKVRFDEIATVVTDRIDKPIESGLKDYIGLEHLDTDCIRIKRFGSTEDVDATKFLCKNGDIIFGKRNSYLRKVAISDRDAVVSAHSMVLRPTGDKIYPDFLPCFMQSSIFWKTAHSISEGSMSPTIKWKTLAAQEFWLPSIEEQKKISELLWSIEDNIQKTEKLIETTETLKQGLLNELLTKGIGHTRFKDSELGRIPEEWKVIRLGDITEMSQYGLSLPLKEEGEYPILKMDNLVNGLVNVNGLKYVDIDEDTFEKFRLQKGDILFNRTNSYEHVGRTSIFTLDENYVFASYLIRLKIAEDLADPYFITKYLIHYNYDIKKIATKSIQQANINAKNLSNYKIRLPNLNEQREIVSILNNIEQRLQNQKEHINKLESLKRKLINEFLTGNLKAERDL
ncbi:restriction endonuclease subunit S [Methanosarcina mazei]|uniref:Type I restriction modification DNA specificity domain-containing protein n=1 Tax=Methanosarcina mazei TaxID=2209 RepID=A0A0F8JW72_METMZ|nr:restriction endonuclease subunit S [Methanosarcina mazei]KKG72995.1 hypothetical protein DU63_16190 [Methanosarcina mazei]